MDDPAVTGQYIAGSRVRYRRLSMKCNYVTKCKSVINCDSLFRRIQNIIASLGNSLESVQHQQAYMHALQHVMAMLQILTEEKQISTRNKGRTDIVQRESRLHSAFAQNDRQGTESTESNRENGIKIQNEFL